MLDLALDFESFFLGSFKTRSQIGLVFVFAQSQFHEKTELSKDVVFLGGQVS